MARFQNPMKLRDYQEGSINGIRDSFRQGNRRVLLVLPTGSGKCLGRGTPVLMHDGSIRKVEDVRVGDLLMGPDSQPRRVETLARGVEELFRVVPVKGDPYVVNRSHVLSLKLTHSKLNERTSCNGRMYLAGDIANVTVEEYLASSNTFKHRAKGWRVAVDFPAQELPVSLPPYILGLWLGDGHSRTTAITTMDEEVVAAWTDHANDIGLGVRHAAAYGRCPTYHITTGVPGPGRGYFSNPMRKSLLDVGVLNNKHVPQIYKANSRHVRLEVLAGLLDSDGHLSRGGYDFINKNEALADDVCFLARSVGLAAYKKQCRKTCGNNGVTGTYWRVSISGHADQVPVRIKRRKPLPRQQKKSPLVTGIRLEPLGEGDYFGFEVSGPDRLFLLGDFTVTHNTVCFSYIAAGVARNEKRVLIIAHRRELLKQISRALKLVGVRHAVMSGGYVGIPTAKVVVASVFTLARRVHRFPEPDLIIGDEAHHFTPDSTWGKVVGAFPKTKVLGVTATPERLDGKGLGLMFDDMVMGPSVAELTEQGFLSRADVYAPSRPDLGSVRTRMGDYVSNQLEGAMDKPSITGSAVSHYAKLGNGKRAIAFCVSVKHAVDVAAEFRKAGYLASHIDGGMDDRERDGILKRFEDGEIQVLTSCDLISEGFDLPAVEVAIMLRPTKSLSLYLQQAGRAIRIAPGKDKTIILDHAGNTAVHGFIDEHRDWKLTIGEAREKKDAQAAATVRTCPKCYAMHRPMPACPKCGHVYKTSGRKIEQREGELVQVSRAEDTSNSLGESDIIRRFNVLTAIGKSRKYDDPARWAFNVICGQEAAKLAKKRDVVSRRMINGLTSEERNFIWTQTMGKIQHAYG
jgi:superfamily II DNA or RNA helicase